MSSLTAQILFGVSDTYHDGIRPEYELFLSENSRAAWVMVPNAVYRSEEEHEFSKVTWIPDPDTMVEDAMVMIGLYIRKDPELMELAAKFLPEVHPKWMEFYELEDSNRQLFHKRCQKMEFRGKLVLTVLCGSTVFNQLEVLEQYRVEREICVSHRSRPLAAIQPESTKKNEFTTLTTEQIILAVIREADNGMIPEELSKRANLTAGHVETGIQSLLDSNLICPDNRDTGLAFNRKRFYTNPERRQVLDRDLQDMLRKCSEADRLYFAYGSNLDIDQMYSRCPNSHFLVRARLDDYKLNFPRFSSSRGGGVAGLESAGGKSVWGALYFVSDQDFKKLDTYEGAPSCYERDEVEVTIVNFGECRAITYQAIPQIGIHRPTRAYLGQIIQGARSLEINEAYCLTLERISVAD